MEFSIRGGFNDHLLGYNEGKSNDEGFFIATKTKNFAFPSPKH